MGKGPTLRASKAKQFRSENGNHSLDDDNEEEKVPTSLMSMIKFYFPDPTAVFALVALVLMLVALGILLWVNSSKDIHSVVADISQNVEVLDIEPDQNTHRRRRDKDDLSETAAAIDAIERAVKQGNLGAARRIISQLAAWRTASTEDIATLTSIVDSAEAANPIAELSRCRADAVLSWIKESGGMVLDGKGAPEGGSGNGIVLADLNRPDENSDVQPQRGLVFLRDVPAGEQILGVPSHLFLSLWSDVSTSPALSHLRHERAAGAIDAFGALAALLLAESHNTSSYYRRYICSLPVHVPLPFQWEEEELPEEFIANEAAMEGRRVVRTLVERSFNTTAALLTQRYPDTFSPAVLTRSKWDWAVSMVLSRAMALRRGEGGAAEMEMREGGSIDWILDILSGGASGGAQAVETRVQALVPGIDLVNHHEASPEMALLVALESLPLHPPVPDAPVGDVGPVMAVVRTGPGGAVRGQEASMLYGSDEAMCATRPLNRYGFVGPPCPDAAAPAA